MPTNLIFLGLHFAISKRTSPLAVIYTHPLTPTLTSSDSQSTRTRSLEGEHVFRKSHYAPLLTLGSICPSLNARSHIRSRRNGQYSHESSGNTYRGPSVVRAPIQHIRPRSMGVVELLTRLVLSSAEGGGLPADARLQGPGGYGIRERESPAPPR